MRRAVQMQNMAPSDRSWFLSVPRANMRLSTLAHGSIDLPPHSKIFLQDDTQDIHTVVTRSTPGRGRGGDTRDLLRDISSSCVLEKLRHKLLASAQEVRWEISQGMEAGTTRKMSSAYLM